MLTTTYHNSNIFLDTYTGRNLNGRLPSIKKISSTPTEEEGLSTATVLQNESSKYQPNKNINPDIKTPWIPVIGMVCPDESVLYKKLVNTFSCSNHEEAQLSTDGKDADCNSGLTEKEELESSQVDPKDTPHDLNLDQVDGKVLSGVDVDEETSDVNKKEDMFIEILNNSAVLEKIMQQLKDALNNNAEILSKDAQVIYTFFHIKYINSKVIMISFNFRKQNKS